MIVDFVPCHTSIEHPWFRERPDFYVWMDAPANNWLARFGGSAWARDPVSERYCLHSFLPASEPFALPLPEEYGRLSHVNSAKHRTSASP